MKIEPIYFWSCLAALGLGTICIRGSLIALSSRIRISPRMRELFSFIPAAMLPAFVAPAVFFHEGHVEWVQNKERLLILTCAVAVSFFTRSTFATIAFGLVALYVIS